MHPVFAGIAGRMRKPPGPLLYDKIVLATRGAGLTGSWCSLPAADRQLAAGVTRWPVLSAFIYVIDWIIVG
jgi:hypothetical protein